MQVADKAGLTVLQVVLCRVEKKKKKMLRLNNNLPD